MFFFNIVSSVGRAKENSEILTDMEHLDMNLKIVKYILNQGYEDKKIGGAFYQRVQVRNSCGGYGKVMAISRKAIFTCASVWSRTRFEWEIYCPMSHRKFYRN